MGGFGSGFQGTAKGTTGERYILRAGHWGNLPLGTVTTWSISIGGWMDLGTVRACVEAGALALTYTPPNSLPTEQHIDIERTPCRLGGSRSWFRCPECGRRCAALYRGGGAFYCRLCAGLNYLSTREPPEDRAFRKADRIRARLGWTPGIANGHGPKPKGMHWQTFSRLVAEHDRHADTATMASWRTLERSHERLIRRARTDPCAG